jgi:hypothetical protein
MEHKLAAILSADVTGYSPAHVELVIAYHALGRTAEARAAVAEILRLSPHFSLEGLQGITQKVCRQ